MRQAEAGQWIVAGTTHEDVDFGRVFEREGTLSVAWESSQSTTVAPTNADGTWPDDVDVYESYGLASEAFESSYRFYRGV